MERVHIPIGTGDHVLELMLNRPSDKPYVMLRSVPQSDKIVVTMVDDLAVISRTKGVSVDQFQRFGAILDEMEEELYSSRKETVQTHETVRHLDDVGGKWKRRLFG